MERVNRHIPFLKKQIVLILHWFDDYTEGSSVISSIVNVSVEKG